MRTRPDPASRKPHGPIGVALAWLLAIVMMATLIYLLWV